MVRDSDSMAKRKNSERPGLLPCRGKSRLGRVLPGIFTALALLAVWALATEKGAIPSYMLPSPLSVAQAFAEDFPILMQHCLVTLQEALYGLLIGIALAFWIAVLMDRFTTVYRALYPVMVVTQTIPTIALAPILVLWMGFGKAPKITLVVITTFFPIAVGLLDGFRSVDPDETGLLRSMGAGRVQIFRHIKLPSSLGPFFSGLKVSASYAVVGAVVSEWLGGFEGLGVYMTRVRKAYAFDRMFAVILLIVILSLLLIALVNVLHHVMMPWERIEKEGYDS